VSPSAAAGPRSPAGSVGGGAADGVGWPPGYAEALWLARGRAVRHLQTGPAPEGGPAAELVVAVRDPGGGEAVTLVSAWFPGRAVAAWAEGGEER
jgi:hypothetical protein